MDPCTWSMCSLGQASGNGVQGIFSLHGHHWDLVTILPSLVLYNTRIECLSRCRRLRWHVSPFYSHRVHGVSVHRRSLALSCALSAASCNPQRSSLVCLICFFLLCSPPVSHSLNVRISRHLEVHTFSWLLCESWESSLPRIKFCRIYLVDLVALDQSTPETSGSLLRQNSGVIVHSEIVEPAWLQEWKEFGCRRAWSKPILLSNYPVVGPIFTEARPR
jgi:hypothetical protein